MRDSTGQNTSVILVTLAALSFSGAALLQSVVSGPADASDVRAAADPIRGLQTQAIGSDQAAWGHWGWEPDKFTQWGSHSNRLIPVFTYGTRGAGERIDLSSYTGRHSVYRSAERLRDLYGRVPTQTLNPAADYLDQTNIYDIQRAALDSGRKYIFLVVFDGMDFDTLRATAIYNLQEDAYGSGRGRGTHLQEYLADGTSQFAFMATAPHNDGTTTNVDTQSIENPGGNVGGGYSVEHGGHTPWDPHANLQYLSGKKADGLPHHPYTDSASSALSMTAGIKSYNQALGVDRLGSAVETIAHQAQAKGYKVGVVSSVPISHATPAASYAHNVHRNDYQDLSRDMLGLPSISHPNKPLSGLDVVIGGGFGVTVETDAAQGKNFVPGNKYITAADLERIDVARGGRYVVAQRQSGVSGQQNLMTAARRARTGNQRLLGLFGVGSEKGHLPYATANGDYVPTIDRDDHTETYTPADLMENPTLADMTAAALEVLDNDRGFWLLVEPGDVDWANHDNNIDSAIGAVNSGDAAVRRITDWVQQHSDWDESLLIVTADHGHLFVLRDPTALIAAQKDQ